MQLRLNCTTTNVLSIEVKDSRQEGEGAAAQEENATTSLHHRLIPLMVETLIRRKEALALQQAHVVLRSEGNLRKFLLGTEEKSGCDAVGLQLPVEAVRTF